MSPPKTHGEVTPTLKAPVGETVNVPENVFVPELLLSVRVPSTTVLPVTVKLPLVMVIVKPLFTVKLAILTAVVGAVMLVLMMTSSNGPGTPDGDQFPAVAQAVPIEVLVT